MSRLAYHQEIVRDCSWHPTQPSLVTASFDGTIVRCAGVCSTKLVRSTTVAKL